MILLVKKKFLNLFSLLFNKSSSIKVSISDAGVPGRAEYLKEYELANSTFLIKSIVSSKSEFVSPGYPQ